ncbi:MAG TPA: von Willebrand factor type A domain-containing protein [Dongiaceae bacterium]|jgi:Ca-activated chloride channel family protein|nr:von Willebrand factor type A domain-containing protein [Dongiaceae bacterium]
MQGSKLPKSRLWIAGVSTALILVGCEAQPVKEDAANANQPSKTEEAKPAGAQGAVDIEAVAPVDINLAPKTAKQKAEVDQPAGAAMGASQAAPVAPATFGDVLYQAPVPGEDETYLAFNDSPVKQVVEVPVSDVDTGAYSNIRRFLMNGQLPPKDAVRVEEMINYFSYDYPGPQAGGDPFRVTTSVERTPWNKETYLLHIGIKGYEPPMAARPAANLVFLVDVSGSMADADKLPLLKAGMKILTDQLRDDDKVTIVVYAGAAGLVLEPTAGKDKAKIKEALDHLEAGGSTAGGEGLALAYAKAKEARIDGGINRIILATDGDFNVGVTDINQLKDKVEDARKSGVSLTTLGFGEGNYNDALMEQIADVGNGNYGYVDSLKEAKRLLSDQLSGTIQTIAKDVKIQIEFNPAVVDEYRLVGYENRALNREDFNNDQKDAGEIGAGHTVTAIYEIALKSSKGLMVDPLRYGGGQSDGKPDPNATEFAFLRLRYKAPDGDVSKLIETPLSVTALKEPNDAPADARFAVAVAAFGQKLRGGDYIGTFGYDQITAAARSSRGSDGDGYRAEFIELVEMAKALDNGS